MTKSAVSLVVRCVCVKGPGRARVLTGITIELASLGVRVALAKLPFRYTPDEALRGFKINPARFTLMPGAAVARGLGLRQAAATVPNLAA